MEICNSYNHEAIVFDVKECPLCIALNTIEELKDEIKDLNYELKEET